VFKPNTAFNKSVCALILIKIAGPIEPASTNLEDATGAAAYLTYRDEIASFFWPPLKPLAMQRLV
jgi:hypothetical protein